MSAVARMAGVTELSVRGRGPTRAFLFDPHRLALPCWALAGGGAPVTVLTLDRHFDLVPPTAAPPDDRSPLGLDGFARLQLDVRNVDHILAGMVCGVVADVVSIARASPVGCFEGDAWNGHHLVRARTVDSLVLDWGTARASGPSRRAEDVLRRAARVVLDVDLDCFTTPSDADPSTVVPWPEAVIRDFVLPPGSEPLWDLVLSKCVALTVAREPLHCGGVVAGGRLFEAAASVLFRELLRADLP